MAMSGAPKVTVFIPVYNRERYIGAAIDSILAQSFADFELLLIDDGSTDQSLAAMRSYADPRIRIVCNEHNCGIPHTRNKGLALARGEYIALLDSDDLAHPKRLKKQVAFLDHHPDYAQVGSWGQEVDEQGRLLKKVKRQPILPEDVHVQLLFRCSLSNRSIMARTALLREYGYRNDFPRCQDYDLHVRLAKRYKLGNLAQVLVFARVHPDQITNQTTELGDARKRQIIGAQLSELGVSYTEADLASHLMLSRMRKMRFTPDAAYLNWADAWLRHLHKANRKTQRYAEPALTRAVSQKWGMACWRARPALGWTAWKYFWRSPLRRGVGARLTQQLWTFLLT